MSSWTVGISGQQLLRPGSNITDGFVLCVKFLKILSCSWHAHVKKVGFVLDIHILSPLQREKKNVHNVINTILSDSSSSK